MSGSWLPPEGMIQKGGGGGTEWPVWILQYLLQPNFKKDIIVILAVFFWSHRPTQELCGRGLHKVVNFGSQGSLVAILEAGFHITLKFTPKESKAITPIMLQKYLQRHTKMMLKLSKSRWS